MHHSPDGACILYFHILRFLRAHHREWLQSDGCYMAGILLLPEFPQCSPAHTGGLQSLMIDPLLLVRNLTNIWETFYDQILPHGAGRLMPGQAKILDMPLQVLIFRLGPIDN